jgi:hypothetical protein
LVLPLWKYFCRRPRLCVNNCQYIINIVNKFSFTIKWFNLFIH